MTETQLSDLKAKHPKGFQLTAGGYELFLKTPARGDYLKFKSMLTGDNMSQNSAGEFLLRACCAHPSLDELTRILDECPGLPDAVSKHLRRVSGSELEIKLGE